MESFNKLVEGTHYRLIDLLFWIFWAFPTTYWVLLVGDRLSLLNKTFGTTLLLGLVIEVAFLVIFYRIIQHDKNYIDKNNKTHLTPTPETKTPKNQ